MPIGVRAGRCGREKGAGRDPQGPTPTVPGPCHLYIPAPR